MATIIQSIQQLGSAAVAVPQCIDNQFMPRHVFRGLAVEGRTLPQVIEANLAGAFSGLSRQYAEAQRTEYVRTLLFSDRVVINRAAFWNSPTLICAALGRDRRGLVQLIADNVIVPFLHYESSFDEPPRFAYLEQGERAVHSLATEPELSEITCVRLGGTDDAFNQRRVHAMAESFRLELSRLHLADQRLERARQIARTLLRTASSSPAQVDELARRVLEVAAWAVQQPPNRNDVYERFVTQGEPAKGFFRSDPFTFELKMWIDLIYTSNLPRFLKARSFTPQGFPTPLDLDMSWALAAHEEAKVSTDSADPLLEDVIGRARTRYTHQAWNAIVAGATVSVPAPHEIDHNDLVKIRAFPEWREMTAAMERHLDSPLEPAGLAEMNEAYRAFLLRLQHWWIEQHRPRREEMAAGVAKVYRVGEWVVGLLQLGNLLLPIVPRPDVPLPPGSDGIVKAVVETTLYVFDRGRVELRRSQAVRGLEKVQKISQAKLREFERTIRGLYPELMELPYVASASTTAVATEEES